MGGRSNGDRAALVKLPLMPGNDFIIDQAGPDCRPFISFRQAYPEAWRGLLL